MSDGKRNNNKNKNNINININNNNNNINNVYSLNRTFFRYGHSCGMNKDYLITAAAVHVGTSCQKNKIGPYSGARGKKCELSQFFSLDRRGKGGVRDRRDVLDLMHDRSRMTIDPRIPTMPRRNMSGFHRPDRHCLHRARNAVRCPAGRMKGEVHTTTTKNRL